MKQLEKNPRNHLWKLAFIIFAIILFGTLGYQIIEKYRFLDAFYMTIITITTVGFQEVKPLDDAGKIFTSILLIVSFGFFAYSIRLITSIVLDGKLAAYYRDVKNLKKIKKMKKHTIVVGFGRNGKEAVQELILHHEPIIIIDSNSNIQEPISENVKWIISDATSDETLLEAGIKEAKAIISALPNDADNLYISISAKSINPDILIISRASSDSAERKLHAIGAHHVIMPEKVGGIYMAGYVAHADLTEFLNHLRVDHYNPGILSELDCKHINPNHYSKTVEELLSSLKSINVLGVKSNDNTFIIAPIRTLTISEVSKIFVMGTKEEIELLKKSIA